jgi:hypothetical protein
MSPTLVVRVRISWGDYPLHEEVLDPPRSYVLGEGRDYELPREALGSPELEWIRVDKDRVLVRATKGEDLSEIWQPLCRGEGLARRVGAFTIDVTVEAQLPKPARRFAWFGARWAR